MFAEVTIAPGCSLGYHEHHGESETYYIIKGQGEYDDNGTKRSTYLTVSKGASFGGNPIRLQAGVGKATVIDEIEVTWPATGLKDVYTNVAVNKIYKAKEGDKQLTIWDIKPFEFRTMERRMAEGDSTKTGHHMMNM